MAQYDRFTLRVRSDGSVEAFLAERGESQDFPVGPSGKIVLDELMGQLLDNFIRRLNEGTLDGDELKLLGQILFVALFPPEVKSLFDKAMSQVSDEQGRRLRLWIMPDQGSPVASWPLEFLRCGGYWLATRSVVTLARRSKGDSNQCKPRQHGLPLRLLVVVSKPANLPGVMSLAIEEIARWSARDGPSNLEVRVLGTLKEWEIPEGVTYLGLPATLENLSDQNAAFRPDIIHFIGHGRIEKGKPSIAFVNLDEEARWCEADEVNGSIERSPPSLMVLQACQTAQPTPALETTPLRHFTSFAAELESIPAVVAMQFEVQNTCATEFARGFYEELAKGSDIDAAVQAGRTRISLSTALNTLTRERHFGAPVLFMLRPFSIILRATAKNRQSQAEGAELPKDLPTGAPPTAPDVPAAFSDLMSKFEGRTDKIMDLLRIAELVAGVSGATKGPAGIENTSASIDLPDLEGGKDDNGR